MHIETYQIEYFFRSYAVKNFKENGTRRDEKRKMENRNQVVTGLFN